MAWIESHQTLREHPKLHKFSVSLGISKREAIGLLHQLWWWVVDYAPTGDLSAFEPMQIAKGCEWEGDAGKLIRCLREARFLDENPLQVHDWMEFCGEMVIRRISRLEEKRRKVSAVSGQMPTNARHPTIPTIPKHPNQPNQPRFGEFWRTYPRKVGKLAAEKAWAKLNPSDELLAVIMAALAHQRTWPQWLKDGGQFIPHPATWLTQRRWEDEGRPARVAPAGDPLTPAQRARLTELTRGIGKPVPNG